MKPIPSLASCLAFAAVGFAGCGGSDDGKDTSSAASTPAATAPAKSGGTAAGGVVTVSMKDIKFIPQTITATAGQKVKWTNDDSVPHTVTAKSGASFDSGTVPPGGTYETTVRNPGTIAYVCQIHPAQTGSITVN